MPRQYKQDTLKVAGLPDRRLCAYLLQQSMEGWELEGNPVLHLAPTGIVDNRGQMGAEALWIIHFSRPISEEEIARAQRQQAASGEDGSGETQTRRHTLSREN